VAGPRGKEEFRDIPEVAPNPLAVGGEPGKVEDMMWFGLVPGLIINKLRQRKATRDERDDPIARLEDLSFRELAELEESLHDTLDSMAPPPKMTRMFVEGYDCHIRLMRWLTELGQRGDAIRHALDTNDGEALLAHLAGKAAEHATDPEFFFGFQAANGDLAERFGRMVPDE
jgi:hypothetical protein